MIQAIQVLLPAATRQEAEALRQEWLSGGTAATEVLGVRLLSPTFGRDQWLVGVYLSEPEDPDLRLPYDMLRVDVTDTMLRMLDRPTTTPAPTPGPPGLEDLGPNRVV